LILAPSVPPGRAAIKDKPLAGWRYAPSLTAARPGGLCSAIRIKPHTDHPRRPRQAEGTSLLSGRRGHFYFGLTAVFA
jgi:hypothetical protein